jgi:nucleotidyltransferase substrate binding protein (TIGR01987 family)
MESLKLRHAVVMQTLKTLNDAMKLFNESEKESLQWWSNSDSMIHRFEYTIDTFWKYLKLYLEETGKIQETIGSPKGILRAAAEAGCITQDEYDILHDGVSDRNDTSHSYNHELAREIVERIPQYYMTIKIIAERLQL